LAVVTAAGLVWFLTASWYVAVALFDRSPHILDAISYLFQAKTFAGGALWAPQPLVYEAFSVPFATLYQDRWFSQYPPGAAATLVPGIAAGVPWLVQPLLAAASVVLLALTVRRQYGQGTAVLVVVMLVTSPFLLLTAGSYLSHVPALFFCALAMFAITYYADRPSAGWAGLAGLGLGLAFLTREIVPILFGSSVVLTGLAQAARVRGRRLLLDLLTLVLTFAVAVVVYCAYNWAVTGHPLLLPRLLTNSADRWGFGQGVGFYGEHTIASGLVNTEQQLVSLGFYAAGWPYGFTVALALLPFLLRRATPWDTAHGSLVLLFMVAYSAYFYHGIAFGPRYYFEALPSLLILTARGATALAETVTRWLLAFGYRQPGWRARQAAGILLASLLACNLLYFLPRQATLYADYSGLPGGGPVLGEWISRDLSGRVPLLENALVVVDEWWYYTLYFAAMNCPRLDCSVIFAHGGDEETRVELRRMYPDRRRYTVVDRHGVLTIVPES
jgi:4-amino-4-deoxy-L-arabinose transferase-like glycosyltransferase